MDYRQNSNNGRDRIRAGLKWIGELCRELRFGSIHGVMIRDGAMGKGIRFRVIRTGKPRPRGSTANHDKLDADDVLKDALDDLQRDTSSCNGEWHIQFKVHKGIPVSWDMEKFGTSSMTDNI